MKTLYPKLLHTFSTSFLFTYGTPLIGLISYYLLNLILYFCYKLDSPLINKYKISKAPWPWKEDPSGWNKLLLESIPNLFINQVVISLSLAYLVSPYNEFKTGLDTLPTGLEIGWQILFCMVFEDLAFHISHKLFHVNEFLYRKIHAQHHKYNNPIGIAAVFQHPVEFILGTLLPISIGPFLLGNKMHIVTVWAWTFEGSLATVDQHSGYDFPFSPFGILPFMFNASYHDFHHTRYKYNYSSLFIFWDSLFGDNDEYYNYLDKKEKKLKA